MASQKKFTVQLFDGSTFLESITRPKNLPSFNSRLNGGLGELRFDLNVPFDDFSSNVAHQRLVDLYAADEDNPRGRRIHRGFVSRFQPYVRGSAQGVEVTVLGLASLLTRVQYNATHSNQDPETIARAIIDAFDAHYPGLITYTNDSTDAVGTNVSYTFTDVNCFDALKKVGELAGTGWWWKVEADGLYHLKAKPSDPTHVFTIGKDVESLEATQDAEGIYNYITVRYNGGSAVYQDATSISMFGRREKVISDTSGLTSLAAANQRGNKELADNKDPKIKAALTINALYDLESIQVGHACAVTNFRKDSGVFPENAIIASVSYSPDSVRIELEESDRDLGLVLVWCFVDPGTNRVSRA